MNEDERRHFDNLTIGIMTLATMIVGGMFALLGFAAQDNGSSQQLIKWVIAVSAAMAAIGYFVSVSSGIDVINDKSADKVQKFRGMTNGFLFTAGVVAILAALVVVSRLQ